MTPLRRRMREDMLLRGLAARTQASYLAAVQQLAVHYHKSPDQLSDEELRQSFLFLCNKKHPAPKTTNVALNGIKVCVSVIAAGGLRLLEGVRLHVSPIARARMQLHIRSGKGNKDRALPQPPPTRTRLRAHWRLHRNPVGLLPGTLRPGEPHASRPHSPRSRSVVPRPWAARSTAVRPAAPGATALTPAATGLARLPARRCPDLALWLARTAARALLSDDRQAALRIA